MFMAVPAYLQNFGIFGLKCSVVNPEVGVEKSGSNQLVVVFLPEGEKRAQPYCRDPQVFIFYRIYLSYTVLIE